VSRPVKPVTTAGRDDEAPCAERHELWSLREDVTVESGPDEESLLLRGRWGDVSVRQPSRMVREALNRMGLGPVSLRNVIGDCDSGRAEWEDLHRVLERLDPLIIRSLRQESGQPIISVVPLTIRSRFRPVPLAPDIPVRLSSYAQLRTDGREFIVESPLALHRVVLHRAESVRLIAPLISPVTPAVYRAVAHAHPFVAAVLEYLVAAGMVVVAESAAGGTPVFAEDSDPRLIGFSPLDMMFQARSTLDRHDHEFGVIFPGDGAASAKPASRAPIGQGVPLHRPRWADLYVIDSPLTAVIEGRRSQSRRGRDAITAVQVGELLYRTARARSLRAGAPGDYAGAGGSGSAFDLELYLTVWNCAGLEPGVYHYDPSAHALGPVDTDRVAWQELLRTARMAAGADDPPQVLITMTARFRQLSWRLDGFAYRMMLMSAGALMQSLYLGSAAMCLAPRAIGTVSPDVAPRALGIDWRLEPCVGHFIVGTSAASAGHGLIAGPAPSPRPALAAARAFKLLGIALCVVSV
jgi:SagB-type dehydrogenase family enzyme